MCRLKTLVTTLILHTVNFSGLVAEVLIKRLSKLMGESFSFLFFWNWTLCVPQKGTQFNMFLCTYLQFSV